jgi:hypothetical protein
MKDPNVEKNGSDQKEELRKRIERDPQLKKDFDFLITTTGLRPNQLLTGLWFDCNLMKAHRQALISIENNEIWSISEDTLQRDIKNIVRLAREIERINQTDFSPVRTPNSAPEFDDLPESLRSFAGEVARKVDIMSRYLKGKKSRIPNLIALTREHSLYELIRSSAGGYHQVRLLRLVNEARKVKGLSEIKLQAFTMWINRFEKRRKETPGK